ncbi:MAG: hypothetical protein WB586_06690 [Chthoniobacterales bacterium]
MLVSSLRAQTPAASPSASSGWQHHHWRHHHAWVWKKLNLSDAQREAIHQIRDTNKSALKTALLAVLTDRGNLDDAIASNSSDIQGLSSKLGTDLGTLIALRAKVRAQILQSVTWTADQKALLSQYQQKKDTWLRNRMNRVSQSQSGT